jgi:hypothetical protein
MTRRLEQQLQRAVIDHLRWRAVPQLFWMHYPAGGFRLPLEAKILRGLGTVAGVPDILAVHRGQLFALELKTKHGRLSPTQVAVHGALRDAGAQVATAHGIDEAVAQLSQWGLLR